ncbi:MAG: ribosome silencing factor [Armatimonadota bacterium]
MDDDVEARALLIASAAAARQAERPVILDLRELTPICDYFVICSGRSAVHTRAITDAIEEAAGQAHMGRHHREGARDAKWIVLDYGDVVVHVFGQETREYYDLERLWRDARTVPVPEETVEDGSPREAASA